MKKYIRKLVYMLYYHFHLKGRLKRTMHVNVVGFNFVVFPTVFSPSQYHSSEVFARFVDELGDLKGKRVLDMGCGSGVISVVAASKGARCLAVDINPASVKAVWVNAHVNGILDNVKAIKSDLFTNLPSPAGSGEGSYDLMFFNPPYFLGIPKNDFEAGFKGGNNYDVIRKFVEDAPKYLSNDGIVYLIISDDMELSLLENMVKAGGFSFEIVRKVKRFFETFYITKSFMIRQ